jgi:thiamine-phosphate diphosphorylase
VISGFPPGLLLITDRVQARLALVDIADAALAAGFAAVMLREKDLDGRELLELGSTLHEICERHGRPLIVNDRLDVALALPGAGAHVGKAGVPVADARRLLGPDRLLGYSAHEAEEARAAIMAGADYVTLSPIFSSASKPGYAPRGIAWLREATAALPQGRVVALGGISADVLAEVRKTGAAGAAIMGEIMRAEYPGRAAAEMVGAFADFTPER